MKLKDAVRETVQEVLRFFNFTQLRKILITLFMVVLGVTYLASGIASVFGTIVWIFIPTEHLIAYINYVLVGVWVSFATLGFIWRVAEKCRCC